MKPLLLIDVDGVLNCFGSLWSEEYERTYFAEAPMHNGIFTIRPRRELRARMDALLEVFEPVWATAWMGEAHAYWAPILGVDPERPWHHIDFSSGWIDENSTWKLPAIVEYLGDPVRMDVPAAWLDDHIRPDAIRYAQERTDHGSPTLFIRTNPCEGLTEEETQELLAWAKRVSA